MLLDRPIDLATDATLKGAIVLASDFSPGAERAQERALRLARASDAPLALVHVLPQDWLASLQEWLSAARGVETVAGMVRTTLAGRAERLSQTLGRPVRAVLLSGHPVQALAEVAAAYEARLVVVGALGQDSAGASARRLLLGTTAERLLRKTQQPMLVVRGESTQGYERVLVPVDFSPWSAPALALADALAPAAHIHLLHAYRVPFEEKLRFAGVPDETIAVYREQARSRAHARLRALAQAQGWASARYTLLLREADAAPSIVETAQTHRCDLIVIGKHGTSAAEDLLLGSVTKHVVAEAPCDVLVSPAAAHGPSG